MNYQQENTNLQQEAMDFEKYLWEYDKIVKNIKKIPREALEQFIISSWDRTPTGIGKHPTLGYFILCTAGQGPMFDWKEWEQ